MLDLPQGEPRRGRRRGPCLIDHEPSPRSVFNDVIGIGILAAVCVPGILSLLLVLPTIPGVPRLALIANPAAFVLVMIVAGAWAAPRVGLRSALAELRSPFTPAFAGAATRGASLGLVVAVADHLSRPLWQTHPDLPPSLVEGWQPSMLITGLLYGGVVEEAMIRWGVMSLVLLACRRLLSRRGAAPSRGMLLVAIGVAALIFAIGHLPALVAMGDPLDPPVVVRTLAWNTLAGLLFGWIFARHDLESAMACHASFHIGVFAAVAIEATV